MNICSSPTLTNTYFCLNTPDVVNGAYIDGGGNNLESCSPPYPELFGDSDDDDDVDMIDLAAFTKCWLIGVDMIDFAAFAKNWQTGVN